MKFIIFCLTFILFSFNAFSQATKPKQPESIKIEANTDKGFAYPYYLYIPAAMREETAKNQTFTLLVAPNNTGKIDDDLAVHEADVKRKLMQIGVVFGKLSVTTTFDGVGFVTTTRGRVGVGVGLLSCEKFVKTGVRTAIIVKKILFFIGQS